jgi:superfamily II DNA or RNA helicase
VNPGSIVRFRNRDWVLLPADGRDVLLLRPLTGTSDEVVAVHRLLSDLMGYSLETERIKESTFPLPSPESPADARSLRLLAQAARLLLREGAAPFRSFGRISVRPRTYQLVPLMLALRLDPVRMLIADDVGVGKTIEAALIIRELWDRGEIRRFVVLCPPYLCYQWQKELAEKFHLEAVVIGSDTIGQLERSVPPGRTVYEHYPAQVVSIDFVKHERNRHAFLLKPPELVVVDEAHGATPGTDQRHLRYELVKELARDHSRHLILLTATPHSGIPDAFRRLLGLLDPTFAGWDLDGLNKAQRARLAGHFVQRTRRDIEQYWEEGVSRFPTRLTRDATYQLSAAYRRLFEAVYGFCTEVVRSGEALEAHRRRMRWWGALALLRCVMSSPRAAQVALRRRYQGEEGPAEVEEAEDIGYVYEPAEQMPADEAPTPLLERAQAKLTEPERSRLRRLEELAAQVGEGDDTKLEGCIRLVRDLLRQGFNPVVWCYYVETAEYVAEGLRAALAAEFPEARVDCLTGRTYEEERRQRVRELMAEPRRVLVATDCLSEGINLQEGFNAVIHYDLPWNPNRLEQREGRVDRYGQPSPQVVAVRYYGTDNPVDGAVIQVLLNKAREIHEALGTYVPVPEEERFVVEALVNFLFFKGGFRAGAQLALPLGGDPVAELHRKWDLDARRERVSRTRFAQHSLRPEEVRREVEATDQVLGDEAAVCNFVLLAAEQVGLQVRRDSRNPEVWHVLTAPEAVAGVPDMVRAALPSDRRGRWTVTFSSREPVPAGVEYVGRNHPFVAALARYIFERTFDPAAGDGPATFTIGRCGCIRTGEVDRLTTLALLRPRYRLDQAGGPPRLAEEVLVVGWRGFGEGWLPAEEALRLFETAQAQAEIPRPERRELVELMLTQLRSFLDTGPDGDLGRAVRERAAALEAAHRRVRQSVGATTRGLKVEAHWPPDVLGLLVLQPLVGGR